MQPLEARGLTTTPIDIDQQLDVLVSFMNHERVEVLFRLEWTKYFGAKVRPKSIFPVCDPVDRENGMMT